MALAHVQTVAGKQMHLLLVFPVGLMQATLHTAQRSAVTASSANISLCPADTVPTPLASYSTLA